MISPQLSGKKDWLCLWLVFCPFPETHFLADVRYDCNKITSAISIRNCKLIIYFWCFPFHPVLPPSPPEANNPGVTFGVPIGVSAIIIFSVILGARIWIKKRKRRIKRMQKNAIRLRTSNVYSISRSRTPPSSTIFNVFFEYLALLEVANDTVELSKNHS